jgi:hypothetical protein
MARMQDGNCHLASAMSTKIGEMCYPRKVQYLFAK